MNPPTSLRMWLSILSLGLLVWFTGIHGVGAPANADSPENGVVRTPVKGSVAQVYKQLNSMLSESGMMVMGELNQRKMLSMTGMNVDSRSLFIGNPTIGKKLFSAEPGAGIVVPIRVNIYTNQEGQTIVGYTKPSSQLRSFHNDKVDQIARKLDETLRRMTQKLTQN